MSKDKCAICQIWGTDCGAKKYYVYYQHNIMQQVPAHENMFADECLEEFIEKGEHVFITDENGKVVHNNKDFKLGYTQYLFKIPILDEYLRLIDGNYAEVYFKKKELIEYLEEKIRQEVLSEKCSLINEPNIFNCIVVQGNANSLRFIMDSVRSFLLEKG